MKFTGHNWLAKVLISQNPARLIFKNPAFAVCALVFCCVNACSQSDASAKKFLLSLFSGYRSPTVVNYLGKAADSIFAPELLSLIRIDEEVANGEVGNLNYDPICDCQDYDISDVRINFMKSKTSEMEAEVFFINLGIQVRLLFKLKAIGVRWRIVDIGSNSKPSLYQFLKKNLEPLPGKK